MSDFEIKLVIDNAEVNQGLREAARAISRFTSEAEKVTQKLDGLDKTGQNVNKTFKSMSSHSGGFLANMRDLSIVLTTATYALNTARNATQGWVTNIVEVNAEMERLRYLLASMSKASNPFQEASEQLDYIRQLSKEVPFSLNAISNSFVKFKAAGIDPLNGSLQAMLDGIAAFGGSDEQLNRITVALQQMAGKGVLSMEEMRQQLGEHLPSAMQVMARALNVTVGQLAEEIATGTVEAHSALEAFFAEMRLTYGGTAVQMMKTFNGQVSQMRTNFTQLATTGQNLVFFEEVKSTMQDINHFLQSSQAQEFADRIGSFLQTSLAVIKDIVQVAWKWRDTIVTIGYGLAALAGVKILGGIINSFRELATSAVQAARAVSSVRPDLFAGWTMFFDSLREGRDRITGFGLAAAGTGRLIATAARGLMAAAPVIGAISLVLYEVIDALDLTGRKFEEAKEKAITNGAETMEELRKLQERNQEEIRVLEQTRQRTMTYAPLTPEQKAIINARYDEEIALLKSKHEEWDKQAEAATKRRLQNDADRAAQDLFENASFKMTREYNDAVQKLTERYDEELTAAKLAGTNQEEVTKAHYARMDDLRMDFISRQIDLVRKQIKDTEEILAKADLDEKARATQQRLLLGHRQQLTTLLTDRNRQREITYNTGASDDANIKKVQTQIKRLNRDIASIGAHAEGTGEKFTQMMRAIEDGNFGNLRAAGQELKDQLATMIQLTAQSEALDKVRSGYRAASRDIQTAFTRMRRQEREWKREQSKDGPLTRADLIEQDIKDGFYEGFGGDIERVKAGMAVTLASLKANAEMAALVGRAVQTEAFGIKSDNAIKTTADQIDNLNTKLTQTGRLLGGMSFAGLSAGLPSGRPLKATSGNPLLDLIASVESGGDYNATLDNGQWTGGAKNLIGMTLNEVRDLQRFMLSQPANRAKYGNGIGSSALGRYQIVGKTLERLMVDMGLSGNELFSPELQDRMALHLAKGRGADVAGLRKEWVGLSNVAPDKILQAYGQGFGPTRYNAENLDVSASAVSQESINQGIERIRESLNASIDEINTTYMDRVKQDLEKLRTYETETFLPAEQKAIFQRHLNKYLAEIEEAALRGQNFGKFESELMGARGDNTSDIFKLSDDDFKKLVEEARRLDQELLKVKETNEANRDIRRQTKEYTKQEAEIQRQLSDLGKRLKDRHAMTDSSEVQRIKAEYDALLQQIEKVYGRESEAYKTMLNQRQQLLQGQLQVEVIQEQIARQQKDEEFRKSMMNRTQLRQYELNEQLRSIEAHAEKLRQAGMAEIEITRWVEEEKAKIKRQYAAQDNQITKTFKQWEDLQGNVQGKIEGWMNSASDGITDLIMGTGDLRNAINGMVRDVVNMSLKWAASQMFNKSGTGEGSKSIFSLLSKGVPMRHLGGTINGMGGMRKNVSALAFADAKYFHGGGVIGKEGLLRNEVPLIGKKGEVVFTPGQVEALGKGVGNSTQTNVISPTINVNASGGTHDQNADLAKQIGKEVEKNISGLVAKEIGRQQRPGNMIGRRFA